MKKTIGTSSIPKEIGREFAERRWLRALEVMALSREADAKMAKLVKQNKGGTFQLSAAGHEMIGAVCSLFLRPGHDWTCAYYRDQPLAIGLGCELKELFGVFLGRQTEKQSRGRMMPYHFSDLPRRITPQSSVVGTQFLPAVGIAQGIRFRGSDEVVYTSGGDGATSQGEFHEALNYAALYKLPVVFVIHDNGYAISVPVHEQVAGGEVAKICTRPGLDVHDVDGCDFEVLSQVAEESFARARRGDGPSVIVARVPRLAAHSNSDDPTKYRTEAEMKQENARDPLARFQSWLKTNGVADESISTILQRSSKEIEQAAKEAMELPFPPEGSGKEHVFFPWEAPASDPLQEGEKIVMVDAINQALTEEMECNPRVVTFGEDVAHGKGGVFGVTRGLTARFGVERCFNTPLAEATIVGVSLGLALEGHLPVAEIQFAEYLWPGFNQLASEVASIHYRSGGEWKVPLVLRMPYGGYIQGGPYHSQSIEGILSHIPGLKIAIPSNAADAKGLLKAAIRDPNPVIFLEHKALYRQAKFSARPDPGPDYLVPFGKANIVSEGSDLTVVGWGMMIVFAAELAPKLAKEGISLEIVDLRTIVPVDIETVIASVKKTGKLLVAHEAPRTSGFGAEIAAQIAESAFEYLDAPVVRLAGIDSAIPYSKPLENEVLPQIHDLEAAIRNLFAY